MDMDNDKLYSKWEVWHRDNDSTDWSLNSYKKVHRIETVLDLIAYTKTIKKIENEIYIMRNSITPVYEDKKNIDGGQISLLVPLSDITSVFKKLTTYILSEAFCSEPTHINGVIISVKRNKGIIKIWFDNYKLFERKQRNNDLKIFFNSPYLKKIAMRPHKK